MKKAKKNEKPGRRVVVLRERELAEVIGGGGAPAVAPADPTLSTDFIVRDWGWWPY